MRVEREKELAISKFIELMIWAIRIQRTQSHPKHAAHTHTMRLENSYNIHKQNWMWIVVVIFASGTTSRLLRYALRAHIRALSLQYEKYPFNQYAYIDASKSEATPNNQYPNSQNCVKLSFFPSF